MQKHKGGTKWFVWTNLHVSHLSKCVKGLVVHSAQEFSFQLLQHALNFPTFFYSFYSF